MTISVTTTFAIESLLSRPLALSLSLSVFLFLNLSLSHSLSLSLLSEPWCPLLEQTGVYTAEQYK